MSRRKTVRVAQLEGSANAYKRVRESLNYSLDGLFNRTGSPSKREVQDWLALRLWEMENDALREMTVAQRSQEDETNG